MPEGPEIRRAADRVGKAVIGVPLRDVCFAFEHLQRFEGALAASQVAAVDTAGKAMLTRFSCGLTVYSHNQLYGRWMVGATNKPPDTNRTLRFAIVGPAKAARLYSASEIDVIATDDVPSDPRIAKLGPDALHDGTTPALIEARLHSKTFRGRQLAALLLDQGFVAGLGNYLRTDILHASRVHPRRRPKDLDDEAIARLADAIVSLTRQSYRTAGITNEPDRVVALKAAGKTRREYRHRAFRRARRKCYTCGKTIVRVDMGGRAVFVCPGCQPEAA